MAHGLLIFVNGIAGVASVTEVSFTNVFGVTDGLSYSNDSFDISSNLKSGMLICPAEAILQVKFPQKDIVGSAA